MFRSNCWAWYVINNILFKVDSRVLGQFLLLCHNSLRVWISSFVRAEIIIQVRQYIYIYTLNFRIENVLDCLCSLCCCESSNSFFLYHDDRPVKVTPSVCVLRCPLLFFSPLHLLRVNVCSCLWPCFLLSGVVVSSSIIVVIFMKNYQHIYGSVLQACCFFSFVLSSSTLSSSLFHFTDVLLLFLPLFYCHRHRRRFNIFFAVSPPSFCCRHYHCHRFVQACCFFSFVLLLSSSSVIIRVNFPRYFYQMLSHSSKIAWFAFWSAS